MDLLSFFRDQEAASAYIKGLGIRGVVLVALLHLSQVIVAIIPGHALCVGCGYAYGFPVGFVFNLLMTVGASQVAFTLARWAGRPLVNRLAPAESVALDAVACDMVGIEPLMVPTTRLAHEQGVGVGDLSQIELLGEPLEAMRVADFQIPSGPELFFRATGLLRFLQNRLVAKPVLVAERCQGCWVCLEHCPAGALSKDGRLPVFDYGKCICCYCCQELCPNDAISLRRPLLARILGGRE